MNDSISSTKAREMDIQWMKAGMPTDGLRIVGYRTAGNRYNSLLTVPGNDNAPVYTLLTHDPETGKDAMAYYHVEGPTLADWQRMERERMEQDMRNEYREASDLYEWASGR